MAKTLVDVLKLKGFRAEAAFSGPQALEMMVGDRFDCVLTDIRMPDVNGVGLLRVMRAMQPSVQVVLMFAYAASDLIREGLRAGAIAGFVKPLDIDILSWFLSKLSELRSIVVVDDDNRCWDKARAALEGRGFRVHEVDEPDGLLPALRPSGQVVFLGAGLNGVPGLELLSVLVQIRRRELSTRLRGGHDTLLGRMA